jgi:serine/threonine-protein kinase
MNPVIGHRYQLAHRLGSGASGEVYASVDRTTGRHVALKLIFAHLSESQDNVVRFERQCRLLSGLRHPAVIDIVDWGFDEQRKNLYLVTERLDGTTLGEVIEEPGVSTSELLRLVVGALEGLTAAHAAGMVHRDVKPDNIFVVDGPPRTAKLIDFGLVRQVDATGPTQTQMGLGTPSYMAPEQATNARAVSFPADVWSVGVLLYRIVSGRLPFCGDGPYETMIRVVSKNPEPLLGVPSQLDDLITACLDKSPAERPAHAGALLAELKDILQEPRIRTWLDQRPHHRAPPVSTERATAPVPMPPSPDFVPADAGAGAASSGLGPASAPPRSETRSPAARRSRWLAGLGFGMAVGVAILWGASRWPAVSGPAAPESAADSVPADSRAATGAAAPEPPAEAPPPEPADVRPEPAPSKPRAAPARRRRSESADRTRATVTESEPRSAPAPQSETAPAVNRPPATGRSASDPAPRGSEARTEDPEPKDVDSRPPAEPPAAEDRPPESAAEDGPSRADDRPPPAPQPKSEPEPKPKPETKPKPERVDPRDILTF